MNNKLWLKKTLSISLIIATIMTYSMVALASSGKIVGEITFKRNKNVTVDNVKVVNSQLIFSSSEITTPEDTSAVINLGKLGTLKLAPKTTLNLSFDEKGISGNLLAGQVLVLNAANSVNIVTPDGKSNKLNAGESALAAGATQDDDDDDDDDKFLIGALLIGGAAALIIAAVVIGDDDNNAGNRISPIR